LNAFFSVIYQKLETTGLKFVGRWEIFTRYNIDTVEYIEARNVVGLSIPETS
jgi:hypothetical protein